MKDSIIKLTDDEGNVSEFFLIEETRINGSGYILVTESDDEEADAYILKDVSDPDSEEAEYVFVDDENELDAVVPVFSEILEDIEFN